MSVLLVTYDLRQPGRNYTPLYKWLKSFNHCSGLESVWLLDTGWSTTQVRDELMKFVDANDRVFVCRVAMRAWANANHGCRDWLSAPARTW
jgi:hypothetical protein